MMTGWQYNIHSKKIRDIWQYEMNYYFCSTIDRGVAQPGLEYSSGGRGVGSSNLLIPTKENPIFGLGFFIEIRIKFIWSLRINKKKWWTQWIRCSFVNIPKKITTNKVSCNLSPKLDESFIITLDFVQQVCYELIQ